MGSARIAANGLLVLLLLAASSAQGQTEKVLYNFCSAAECADGTGPTSNLTSDGKGNFYGTTSGGGTAGAGTVFELSPNGSGGWNEAALYSFCSAKKCADGNTPTGPVIFDTAGNLYGTTKEGGAYSEDRYGTVFKLSRSGENWTESVLYNFCTQKGCKDGFSPVGGVVMDASGNLYGVTYGTVGNAAGIFELSPSGEGWTEQVIHHFSANGNTGLAVNAAGDIFCASLTSAFELAPNGKGGWTATVIHNFGTGSDGAYPDGAPVLDAKGNLYGTTFGGGVNGYGTVYELTPAKKGKWPETILYSFAGEPTDGINPAAGVVLNTSGNIYGTTIGGGENGDGIVFELAPGESGYVENVLWNFNGTDGADPYDSLILDSQNNLYGTTSVGGASNNGVVFEVTP